MIVSVIRIILTCIIFCNYGIHCKIQKKTKITILEIHSQYFFQFIVLYNLSHHNKSTGTQTTASCASVIRDWQLCIWKVRQIVLVWPEHIRLFLRTFPYSRTLWICELLFPYIKYNLSSVIFQLYYFFFPSTI